MLTTDIDKSFQKITSLNETIKPPLRGDFRGLEKLREEAKYLALNDRVSTKKELDYPLLVMLKENRRQIEKVYREIIQILPLGKSGMPPAAEWLLDNFYLIKEQIKMIEDDLSLDFYQRLPKLTTGSRKGDPRVYGMALKIITDTDSRLDYELLIEFVNAYQGVAALSSSEIWAIPIMLRLALIENLRRLMDQTLLILYKHQEAQYWANNLIKSEKKSENRLIERVSNLFKDKPDPVFVVYFLSKIRDIGPQVTPVINLIEQQLEEQDIVLEEFIRIENHRRAVDRISVGNIITSLRTLMNIDWRYFYEETSLVEKILRKDPIGIYHKMDFASRDLYRHQVELLSRFSKFSEQEIARRTIRLANVWMEENFKEGSVPKEGHVGYYLISTGDKTLKSRIGYQPNAIRKLKDNIKKFPAFFYFSLISLIWLVLVFITSNVVSIPFNFFLIKAGLFIVLSIAISEVVINLVNWLVTLIITPQILPKLELSDGITKENRTIVVVPCLISSKDDIDNLLNNLEKRFLANDDENLYFALLSDFADAPKKEMPNDKELVNYIVSGIKNLNKNYSTNSFFFFHRERLFNSKDNAWMGWERKRGKLMEFNRLLNGSKDTSYTITIGNLTKLSDVKYVITLDADTELPLDTAKRLIGTISHPLNKAVIDPLKRKVVEGYGIIQPRVDIKAPSAVKSLFAQILTSESGLDPYSSAVSNVYQDLFSSGIFIGKAIYDVEAVERVIQGRFPENTLLSHDLIEGLFARTGLASDIELLEDFPSTYNSYAQRQHRWIRGDWQIANWLTRMVPEENKKRVKNHLTLIDKWKMFDNLRRSLAAPSAAGLMISSWFLPENGLVLTLVGLISYIFPIIINVLLAARVHPKGEGLNSYWSAVFQQAGQGLLQILLFSTLLFHQAYLNINAISKAITRRMFTQKKLLEWTAQAFVEKNGSKNLNDYIRQMGVVSLVSLILILILFVFRRDNLGIAWPFLALWIASPVAAFKVSRPVSKKIEHVSEEAKLELRKIAAKIWRFFDETANEANNFLPPDIYQLEPKKIIARKTSPTNIGLYFLSCTSAFDFGWISKSELVEKLEKAFLTLDKFDRYRGHFYNWYMINNLEVLSNYISTVDSGNMAGCLLALKESFWEIVQTNSDSKKIYRGLKDLSSNLKDEFNELNKEQISNKINESWLKKIKQFDDDLDKLIQHNTPQKILKLSKRAADLMVLMGGLKEIVGPTKLKALNYWLTRLDQQINTLTENSDENSINERLKSLANRAERWIEEMDFSFLFNPDRKLFSIGYNLNTNRLDESYYDLLASEARITSFLLISQKKIPAIHWFKLSRPLKRIKNNLTLMSWGGSMFEHLMPELLMKDFENTILDQSIEAVVKRQIDYGKNRKVPWGISESGFYAFDFQLNYQYRLFGVPDLGLRIEFQDNLVIAPYATFLALSREPTEAWHNLLNLKKMGVSGKYGFFESVDFTSYRMAKNQKFGIVKSYLAHHQGMSLLALNNYLNQQIITNRFHSDLKIKATELLLQEKIPRHTPTVETTVERKITGKGFEEETLSSLRFFSTANTTTPRINILSNGKYSVVNSNAGGGYSAYGNIMINRYQEDATLDNWGSFCYVKDTKDNYVWSTTYQPTLTEPKNYEVVYYPFKSRFKRLDRGIETKTDIMVSPENNIEIREVALTNTSKQTRNIELTSYTELALDDQRAISAHPAFSKLFIESEYNPESQALIFKRRSRSENQKPIYGFHFLTSENNEIGVESYETDRARFIGRGRNIKTPIAMEQELSNSSGIVLDPIMSLRCVVDLKPGETKRINFITGMSFSRKKALKIISKYKNTRSIERTQDLARVHSEIEQQHIGITPDEANLYRRLASRILYPEPILRASEETINSNIKGQSGLYAHGISGDYKIVILKVRSDKDLDLIRKMLLAHEYLRMRNFPFDLVILEDKPDIYIDELKDKIQYLIDTSLSRPYINQPGGIFLRLANQISHEDKILLETCARVIIDGSFGNLMDHLNLVSKAGEKIIPYTEQKIDKKDKKEVIKIPVEKLMFDNELGGFSSTKNEYVIKLEKDKNTPLPWSNVISNPNFGTLVTESGLGYTWSENSQLNKLTPWSNDPVMDVSGEVVYLKDEETHKLWTPTPLPIREEEPYVIRHGQGYSTFEHNSHEFDQQLTVFVDKKDPVKIIKIKLTNHFDKKRKLSLTFLTEWVLGSIREPNQQFIVTSFNKKNKLILSKNNYNEAFKNKVAFLSINSEINWVSGDRKEILGRNGSLSAPKGLMSKTKKTGMGRIGACLDPAGIIQTLIDLDEGEEKGVVIILGQASDEAEATKLALKYQNQKKVDKSFKEVKSYWKTILEKLQIKTPNKEMDLLINNWLLYQNVSCRYWGRSGFYQSGGAYGFRDQLQDVMSLVWSEPRISYEHILRAASHQFIEGDVMHWWHSINNTGVRTRIADGPLWLPFVVEHYIRITGDKEILDEKIPYVKMPKIKNNEKETYGEAEISEKIESIYQHCLKAINKTAKFGEHGLPLIKSGDWNDGMNSIGDEGRGESVWLGWFLYDILIKFSSISEEKGDVQISLDYSKRASELKDNLNSHGWDGDWYRRAYFDNGLPVGAKENRECFIDTIAQSWAVISKGGDEDKINKSMESVERFLIRENEKLILLLTPPFDTSTPFAGYIQGYPPGIRENGGQYTHGAVWLVKAMAQIGNGDRAMELFSMLNPINHTKTLSDVDHYKAEPYVMAADVYSHHQHWGRAGWTWYTGSAGWMYQVGIESILGLKKEGNFLKIDPSIPKDWPEYQIEYKWKNSRYKISIINPDGLNGGVKEVFVDGILIPNKKINLIDDDRKHQVRVVLGK